jgi:hypothetical protein
MMRISNVTATMTCVLVLATAGWTAAAPNPSPSPPTVDGGSKTSGLAGEPVPQPSPPQRIQVGPDGTPLHPDKGPDTPGKTGLGNDQTDSLGGADKGPGTQDVVPRNAQ